MFYVQGFMIPDLAGSPCSLFLNMKHKHSLLILFRQVEPLNGKTPQKSDTIISKAMEYMFGW